MPADPIDLSVGGVDYAIWPLGDVSHLPFSLRVLLENVLRTSGAEDAEAIRGWRADDEPSREIAFTPARVLLQDFTGVPAVVDLAAMRDAMRDLGGDPARINPLLPAELVIDHSVQVDVFASPLAVFRNTELEFERNRERYAFLRWGQQAFENFRVVPPDTGIVHQVNLEYLARVVEAREVDGRLQAFPDTLVGTDSHTTMVNGLGVLGWGVGGIEAEAAMLGEAVSMLVPQVVGFKLTGALPERRDRDRPRPHGHADAARASASSGSSSSTSATGLAALPLADRATIGNMSPEYGATCGFFPVDERHARVPAPDRPRRRAGRAGRGVLQGEQGLWHDAADGEPAYSAGRRARPLHGRAEPRRARGARRTACRSRARSRRSSTSCRPSASTTATRTTRPSPTPSRPAIRSPTRSPATSDRRRRPATSGSTCAAVALAERPQGSRSSWTARASSSSTARS